MHLDMSSKSHIHCAGCMIGHHGDSSFDHTLGTAKAASHFLLAASAVPSTSLASGDIASESSAWKLARRAAAAFLDPHVDMTWHILGISTVEMQDALQDLRISMDWLLSLHWRSSSQDRFRSLMLDFDLLLLTLATNKLALNVFVGSCKDAQGKRCTSTAIKR